MRSVWHLKVYKCMCTSDTTCCQNCVICILPAKNDFYRQYIFLLIFVLWFHCNTNRALLQAPYYVTMPSNFMHGVVYTVQKCMLRYSTYISLREGPILCLSVWSTSFWVVLGIRHLHSIHFEVFFAITEDFHHTL